MSDVKELTIEEKAELLKKHLDEEYKMFKSDMSMIYGESCLEYHIFYDVIKNVILEDYKTVQRFRGIIESLYNSERPLGKAYCFYRSGVFGDDVTRRVFKLSWFASKMKELDEMKGGTL